MKCSFHTKITVFRFTMYFADLKSKMLKNGIYFFIFYTYPYEVIQRQFFNIVF